MAETPDKIRCDACPVLCFIREGMLEACDRYANRGGVLMRVDPHVLLERTQKSGGEVVPFALARIPMIGETRGNMAAGGRPEARPLTDSDRHIAETMAKRLWAEGLFLVGLDVIGSKVTEINVTSPTGFVEIKAQTGFDVAAMFIRNLESVLQS